MFNLFGRSLPPPPAPLPTGNVVNFLADLSRSAPPVGQAMHAFAKPDGGTHGYVQFIVDSDSQLTIHRLWSCRPGQGSGSIMLRILCDLADEHRVQINLKVIPFGKKPYPLSRDQLINWYRRYAFDGNGKKMIRVPNG
jgi:hypothetical protein